VIPNDALELGQPTAKAAKPSAIYRLLPWVTPFILLALVVAGWEIWVRWNETPRWYLPGPSLIARTTWNDRVLLVENGWVTLREILAGFSVAVVAGVATAIAIASSRIVERALYPLVIASQAIPIVALAPLLLIWFGHGMTPKVIMTALIAFFPITVATADGLRSADRETLNLMRTLGASRWQRFRLVSVPSALPSFFSGARIGIAVAVIGAVIGELVGSNAGLGHMMTLANASLRTDRVFACVLVLSVMAVVLFALVAMVERAVLPWRRFLTASE
jgi:ABC-type nitrate/sulfonate/bicarbonate transport system permease component